MLQEFTTWLLSLVVKVFAALWDFVADAFINILDLLLSAVVGLISLIPLPAFISGGLQSLFSSLDPGILYLITSAGLPLGLGFIGAAYVFKLIRKVVTLFQW